jgi:Antibiotic biosynthesis monooxygenase
MLPGRQAKAASILGASLGLLRPVVVTCDHYCTITAHTDQPLFGPREAVGYHGWVELITDAPQQRLLADFNIAETVSAIRHLPGFRSASFFLQQDRPVVYEHVVWESEPHLTAALQHPSFTRHLAYVAELAVASWTALRPLDLDAQTPDRPGV